MPALNSKVQICNLANGSLGLKNSINNIDTPKSDKEVIYALWYDITRQYMLKLLMPNFSLARDVVAAVTVPAAYVNDYSYAYAYPINCLKLLGLGPIDTEDDPPTIENNMIFTNTFFDSGAPIRFIADIVDVSRFTPDFIFAFATVLGKCTALSTTQDSGKKAALLKEAASEFMNTTAQNAQENKPVRRSVSRFRESRRTNFVVGRSKR